MSFTVTFLTTHNWSPSSTTSISNIRALFDNVLVESTTPLESELTVVTKLCITSLRTITSANDSNRGSSGIVILKELNSSLSSLDVIDLVLSE